jgi:hypothetical protein
VAVRVAETAFVEMLKVALLAPAARLIDAGTGARHCLLLVSETVAPPVGAGAESATVPTEEAPPVTVAGLSTSDASDGGDPDCGFTVRLALRLAPP